MYILYSSTISIGNYLAFTSLSPNSGKSDKYLKLYNANTCMYASTALSHENRLTQKRGTKAQRRAIVWITGEAGQSGAPVFFWAQIIGLSLKRSFLNIRDQNDCVWLCVPAAMTCNDLRTWRLFHTIMICLIVLEIIPTSSRFNGSDCSAYYKISILRIE